jgi:hypothetical protein
MRSAIGFYYVGAAYCDETKAILTRMSLPSMKLKTLVNTTVVNLKDAGILAKADVIRFMKIDSQVNGLLNWKKNANNALAVNSPIFTPYSGFRSASASGGYINANYNPYTDAVNASVNNISVLWGYTNYDVSASDLYSAGAYGSTFPYILFRPYRTNTTVTVYLNSGAAASSFSGPQVNALHHIKRAASTNQYYKQNGNAFLSGTNASATSMPNYPIFELATNHIGNPTNRVLYEQDFAFYGAALSDTEAAALFTIYTTWNNNIAATA